MVAGERGNNLPRLSGELSSARPMAKSAEKDAIAPAYSFMQADRSVGASYSSTTPLTAKNEFINYTASNGFSGFYRRPSVGNWVDCYVRLPQLVRSGGAVQFYPNIYTQQGFA